MERMHQHHREAIGRFYPICAQTPAARRATVESGEIHELAPGSFLFDKGDLDSRALYLLEGHVDLLRNSQLIETVRGGSEAARHALEQATPRRLTAVTRTRAVVFAVDATLLGPHDGEKQAGSDVNVEVADIVENRDGDWMTRLLQTTLLARLPVDNIQQLFSRMQALPFAGGEVVVRQGERCDHYHVVQEGRCVVTRHPAGDEGSVIRLAELGAGDGFGEEGLVSGGTCVATVTMVTDGIVMRLGKDDFDVLVKQPCTVAVGQAQALARVAAGARWLDVRRTRDPAAELPGSIHVPMGTLRMRVQRLDPDVGYVACCDTGELAATAAFLLVQHGLDACYLASGLDTPPGRGLEDSARTSRARLEAQARRADAALGEVERLKAEVDAARRVAVREREVKEARERELAAARARLEQAERGRAAPAVGAFGDVSPVSAVLADADGCRRGQPDTRTGLAAERRQLHQERTQLQAQADRLQSLLEEIGRMRDETEACRRSRGPATQQIPVLQPLLEPSDASGKRPQDEGFGGRVAGQELAGTPAGGARPRPGAAAARTAPG